MTGKEIKAENPKVTAIYRFIGRKVYLKTSGQVGMQYAQKLIVQIKEKGGSIIEKGGWLMIDMFGEHTEAKLGQLTIDLKTASDDTIQSALVDFFLMILKQSGMTCTITDL